jgi:hypothetical protein
MSLGQKAVVWSSVLAAAVCRVGCSGTTASGRDHQANNPSAISAVPRDAHQLRGASATPTSAPSPDAQQLGGAPATTTSAPPSGARQHGGASTTPTVVKFSYTGQAVDWQVPAGVTSVTFEAAGGNGGRSGTIGGFRGQGADIEGTVAVTPEETLVIVVGRNGTMSSPGGWGYDGMSGGPANTAKLSTRNGGAGGGATFIGARNGTTVQSLVISAGGGGFGGASSDPPQRRR